MNYKAYIYILFFFQYTFGQVYQWNTNENGNIITYKVQMDSEYLVETVYENNPPKFLRTRGGFYEKKADYLMVKFEFNSNFINDSIADLKYVFPDKAQRISISKLELDGKWLMAGRVGSDGSEKRRDTSRSRKTLKFLVDGYFQWTAFNTDTFQFYGCGGGKYSANDGEYKESIVYFSRDNSRSGQTLTFKYEKKENDWYHSGLSSKGKPLHEIWTLRIKK
tara:strand:+ start:62 stop:724 length:663 start_codon:yes stop_codon:yes gene_type:complete